VVVVTLLLTFLITSADSGILIINTLASGGDQSQKSAAHVIIWGVIFAVLVAVLLAAGGMGSLRSAMIIGALPFSLVMALMTVAMVKVLVLDSK
jgi:choline-glycine betaine transporter